MPSRLTILTSCLVAAVLFLAPTVGALTASDNGCAMPCCDLDEAADGGTSANSAPCCGVGDDDPMAATAALQSKGFPKQPRAAAASGAAPEMAPRAHSRKHALAPVQARPPPRHPTKTTVLLI